MPDIAYETLTDAELEQMRSQVAAEQERRVQLSRLPGQIEAAIGEYLEAGGDPRMLPRLTVNEEV